MNKALLLVLVTIVQSQSDGTLLSTNPILSESLDDIHNGLYLEDLEELEYPRVTSSTDDGDDENLQKRSAVDPLTRRSALDKNFMRFGRSGFFPDDTNSNYNKNLMRFSSETEPISLSARSANNNFLRFGRGQHDNFLRFGKGQKDNFIRFGRGAKDNFIRFGRGPNDNFMRFGKSIKDNFIRFGKLDKNFMRFGRSEYHDPDFDDDDFYQRLGKSSSNFLRFGKSPKSSTGFVRFGKSPGKADNFIRFGRGSSTNRNSTNFLRFGRDDPTGNKDPAGSEVDEVTDPDVDLGDLDLNGEKLKNGPIIRIKRKANGNEKPKNNHGNGFIRYGRDAEIMEEIPKLRNSDFDDDFRSPHHDVKRSTENGKVLKSMSHILSDLRNGPSFEGESVRPLRLYSGLESGFPNFALSPEFSILPQGAESKRNQGGSNFIRLLQQHQDKPEELDINCVDPLNRSALIAAIENENIELIRVLLESNIKVKDALLHAIKEQYVEAVELLLEWEEKIHVPGQPYSWEAVDRSSSTFTPDITPLILAAHMNNYEILKILLDRGATLPTPHDVRCGCDDCIQSSESDSLRHSQARINAYKALSASSLIALSSRDPLLTAFELSWELRRLSFCEAEFRAEYREMRAATQDFATALLDHARTSAELEVMLNFNPDGDVWEPGERQTLERLKLAIKYKQKKFVAHPNVQQLLASIWYDGLPGFRRKNMFRQLLEVLKLGCMFPLYSFIYMVAPDSKMGLFMKKPFVKFIFHSTSYAFFLMLLGLASQRVEFLIIEWFGNEWMREILADWKRRERGSFPGLVEGVIMIYMASWIYHEVRELWTGGLQEYLADLWNIVDFITNCFYMIWIALRFTAIFIVMRESWAGLDPYTPREEWHPFDPMLLSEGAFAAGMIFSFLKLVHIFSVNPHLGPLQISLGRMIIDILKFFFIYTLVLFAFGCGMNQLMWYYADLEKMKCYVLPDPTIPDFDENEKACTVWRRFANLFETSQSLFWASFGLVDLMSFDLAGIKSFTRFWALLLFGSYSVINIIVLLNMLIAMMSNSYQIISERSDIEWKFARSHLWISYFDEGDTLPAPFNLVPTTKLILNTFGCREKPHSGSIKNKSRVKARERHDTVMRLLVRRYITAEQRKRDEYGITEDDVIEIRQDISTLRYELIDIFKNNGMKTPEASQDSGAVSKKGKVMERRLIKDFQIGIVEGIVNDAIQTEKGPSDMFTKIARAIGKRTTSSSKKKDWNAIVRKNTIAHDPIGSTDERKTRQSRQSIRRYIIEKNAALETMDPEKLVEYNPKLSSVTPATRVAYAKFKIAKIKQEFADKEDRIAKGMGDSLSDGTGITNGVAGDDDVFEKSPRTTVESTPRTTPTTSVTSVQEGSIIRPRPRSSSRKTPAGGIAAPPGSDNTAASEDDKKESGETRLDSTSSAISIDDEEEKKKEFRPRTPIPEESVEENDQAPQEVKPEPVQSDGIEVKEEKSEQDDTDEHSDTKSDASTVVEEGSKNEEKAEASKTPEEKPKEDEEQSRKPLGPTKIGGKSKLTGEILTGWL